MRAPSAVLFAGLVLVACGTSPATSPTVAPETSSEGRIVLLIERLSQPDQRVEARRELQQLGPEAMPHILTHADHSETAVRWEIANLIGTLEDERGRDLLVSYALRDPDPHVRWRSLWALSRILDAEEVDAFLIDGLESDNEDDRWNAAIALSFFDSPEGLDVIHENLMNPDPFRRWEAINALGRVHDDRSVDRLRPLLDSPSIRDRNETVLTLGTMSDERVTPLLLSALGDPSPEVRWRAAMSLGRAKASLETIRALEQAAENDPDETVREWAEKSLRLLRDQS